MPAEFGRGGFPLTQVTSQAITEQFGGDVLVRPDGVIAAIGADAIEQWLHDLSFDDDALTSG
jgi:hypothetical protein